MFDVRNNLANAVSAELTNHFGDKVFRTIVPRNVRLAEAPSHGQSIVGYDRGSRGSVAYLGLAGELLRRQRSEERRVGQECVRRVNLGVRRIIKKKIKLDNLIA